MPMMDATNSNIIRIASGDFSTQWHSHRHCTIFNNHAILDFVKMKRHAQVGAIALVSI
jgi:hypothetical protein